MGAFAKKVAELRKAGALPWEEKIQDQETRLHNVIPSTQEETMAKALEQIKQTHARFYNMGHKLRQSRMSPAGIDTMISDNTGGIPGREVVVDLPALEHKAATLQPFGNKLQQQVSPDGLNTLTNEQTPHANALQPFGNKLQQNVSPTGVNSFTNEKTANLVIDLPADNLDWFEGRFRSKEAGLLSPITVPLGNMAEEAMIGTKHRGEEALSNLTRTTEDPATLPAFYPAMTHNVMHGFTEGYHDADKEQAAAQHAIMDAKLESARKAFEEALATEYHGAHKTASGGELIDKLGQVHVKAGAGELNKLLGAYLGVADVLGEGSYYAARNHVRGLDPRYQQLSATREAIKNRMRNNPPPIQIAEDPIEPGELTSSVQYEPPKLSDLNPEITSN